MAETAIRATAPRRARGVLSGCFAALFNLLALIFVVLACVVGLSVAAVYSDPQVLAFIPGAEVLIAATQPQVANRLATATLMSSTGNGQGGGAAYPTLPPEWTATITPTASDTPLPPTGTPVPSETAARPTRTTTPTITPTPTRTRSGPTPTPSRTRSAFNYTIQNDPPTYLANFVNDAGCSWFGVVGQVFGLDGRAVLNLLVHLEGGGISVDSVTGSAPQVGAGGYMIPISDHPIETTDTYRIQLRDSVGTPLSHNFTVRTYGDCTKNVVIVNFVQNH